MQNHTELFMRSFPPFICFLSLPHFCSSVHFQSQGSYGGQVSVSDAHLTLKSDTLSESTDGSLLLSASFQVFSGFLLHAFFFLKVELINWQKFGNYRGVLCPCVLCVCVGHVCVCVCVALQKGHI